MHIKTSVTNILRSTISGTLIACLLVIATPLGTTYAVDEVNLDPLPAEEQDLIRKDANWYDPSAISCAASGTLSNADGSSFVPKGTPEQIAKQTKRFIWNYLTSAGRLSPAQAAGLMGNMQTESGFIPTRLQGAGMQTKATPEGVSPIGWGLVQWSPGTKVWVAIQADPFKRSAGDVGLQMDILWAQLTNPDSVYVKARNNAGLSVGDESAAGKSLLASSKTDPKEAAIAFERDYERHGEITQIRQTQAIAILAEFGSGAGGADTDVSDSSSTCQGTTGDVAISTEGWAFPLQTTKAVIKKGSKNSAGEVGIWCYTRQTNCHHDYNAADIHAPTGTIEVAISDGEVVYVHSNSMVIKSNNPKSTTQYVFYYAHILRGSFKVKAGDTVKAGQPVSRVGTIADALNTAPHLHVDMQKSPPQETRENCSGAACSGMPFLNIQPLLVNAYEGLPE
jgi:murein DD-endopeptidase MepM/ murein hydrolase activator NlpD